MTEPPRPPGDGYGGQPDPTAPPPPPSSGGGAYAPPPSSGGGAYAPPPTSGAGGYAPPPTSDAGGYPPAGGGYPPAGGGYPPAGGGYPPAGGGYYGAAAPAGYANSDEKTWALVAHFGGAAGAFIGGGTLGWVAPLVALLAKGNESPTVRAHAVAALNFQIVWTVVTIIGWALACVLIGFIIAPIAIIIAIVFGIIAGVKANDGQLYKYPLTINMVK
jgi:uncharacterized Tic20 family protein